MTSLLKQSRGGLKEVMTAMRMSSDPNLMAFLETYDEMPKGDRDRVPWEAIALAAHIEPTYLLGSAILALQSHSVNRVKIIALSNHADVVRKRVEFAKLPGGFRDRDALDTAMGLLPTNKGNTFIGRVNIAGDPAKTVKDEAVEGDSDIDYIFPSVQAMQEKLQPIRQKLLKEGS